jgi:hypothetical protein
MMPLNDSPEINHHGRDFVAWLRHSSEISIIPLKSTEVVYVQGDVYTSALFQYSSEINSSTIV